MENQDFEWMDSEDLHLEDLFCDPALDNTPQWDLCGLEYEQELAHEDTKQNAENIEVPVRRKHKREQKLTWQESMLLYLHDLVYLLAAVVVVFLLLFRVVVVSGTSMNGTLLDGDYLLLVGDVFYREPQRGDIIVASKDSFENGVPIVKRVIATEGQWVDIDFNKGIVYVNNKPLDEPYTLTPTNLYEGVDFPILVEEGCLFVMGDNRNDSRDSRYPQIGLIDCREVLGKVVFLFMPGTNGVDAYGNPNEQRDFTRIGAVN